MVRIKSRLGEGVLSGAGRTSQLRAVYVEGSWGQPPKSAAAMSAALLFPPHSKWGCTWPRIWRYDVLMFRELQFGHRYLPKNPL